MLLLATVAWSADPAAVVRPVGRGVVVDWTRGRLEARGTGQDVAPGASRSAREQAALADAEERLSVWVGAVQVLPGVEAGRLEGFDRRAAVAPWTVAETRYHVDGGVEVVATVDLGAAFAPWSVARSVQPDEKPPAGPTGVVIDARGLAVEPSLAPRVVDGDGSLLHEGELWRGVAFERAPCAWVTSLLRPEAGRAGPKPVFVVAEAVRDGALVLSASDAEVWRGQVVGTEAERSGALVVLLDR